MKSQTTNNPKVNKEESGCVSFATFPHKIVYLYGKDWVRSRHIHMEGSLWNIVKQNNKPHDNI